MIKEFILASLVLALAGFVRVPMGGTESPFAPVRAEANACSDGALDDAVREQVYGPGSAFAVRPIQETVFVARAIRPVRTMGATLHVHARPGMTQQYLERELQCHARRGQAVSPADPLVIQDGSVRDVDVRSAGGAFAVRVTGDSPAAGRAIFERATSLVHGAVSVQQFWPARQKR